jgi:hypothetical protein
MPALASELRTRLERTIVQARAAAESGARAALDALGAKRNEPFPKMNPETRRLRNALRARARQLGNGVQADGFEPLIEEVAYEQWHRMLFARFLAENSLLMHPSGVSVTLAECAELAPEEGEPDAWSLAARYAGLMLPGIFRTDDPSAQVRFTPEGRQSLEAILAGLPPVLFATDDALGWVYQFWQAQRKDEVNASGNKIGAAELPAVTQLFTEDYMVRFLLENSLGAWWAARHPNSPLVETFQYLRYRDDGTPAAGTFPGWPDRAAHVTMMDPFGGAGHFVVAEFEMLRRMRMEEDGLSSQTAGDSVIRDNVFMLEIDPRCTQIAAFALALAAWKTGGYRHLPTPNIACSGIPVTGQLDGWLRLAGTDFRLRTALERLYRLFSEAPMLGSLINPTDVPQNEQLFTAEYEEVAPLFGKALEKEQEDPAAAVFGSAAEGVAKAARLLAGSYTLIATNVPYLGRGMQSDTLKEFTNGAFPDSKADLATVCLERCLRFTCRGGSAAVVTPQNWLFLATYRSLRKKILRQNEWNMLARLGTRAFRAISGEVVNVALLILSNSFPRGSNVFVGLDANGASSPDQKEQVLRTEEMQSVGQCAQLDNPDYKIILGPSQVEFMLSRYAWVFEGMHSGDYIRFGRKFWELDAVSSGWVCQQGGPIATMDYVGREHVILWENGKGALMDFVRERLASETVTMWIKGYDAWGKSGVAVSVMSDLKATLYTGEVFTHGVVAIIPKKSEHLPALWAFCRSPELVRLVRKIDQKVCVARASFDSVPFDLGYWQKVAAETGPVPRPHSDDPTQWIFGGTPSSATEALQVAVARLLGFQWPQQSADTLDHLADRDGIVCLQAVRGESPAAQRLHSLLSAAHGSEWSPAYLERLLTAAGYAGKKLEEWLVDAFFTQHCRLFHNRPFIWHIWDGRTDGFSALVNYHRLDSANLDRLIYTYLGDWINTQRADSKAGVAGADGRLVAALQLQEKLKAIQEGEPPHDIYVRWKPLRAQPIGWQPDLNDGVRLNIRPFVLAGVLRSKFTINWNKDRGTNPDGSERLNDLHFTRAAKLAARAQGRA